MDRGSKNPERYLTKEQQEACLESAAAELIREITQGRAIELAGKTVLARIVRGKRNNGDRGFRVLPLCQRRREDPLSRAIPELSDPCMRLPIRPSGAAVITFGLSARHARPSSAAKAAVARLIGTDGAEEVNLAKGRP
jgi:hypothetical protein